jgi:hypothetical protein
VVGRRADSLLEELDLSEAARRAEGVQPVALRDGVPGLLDRPDLVVYDRVAVRGVADAFEVSVGAADDADDAVVGDRYS